MDEQLKTFSKIITGEYIYAIIKRQEYEESKLVDKIEIIPCRVVSNAIVTGTVGFPHLDFDTLKATPIASEAMSVMVKVEDAKQLQKSTLPAKRLQKSTLPMDKSSWVNSNVFAIATTIEEAEEIRNKLLMIK